MTETYPGSVDGAVMTRYLVPDKCIFCGIAGGVALRASTPRGAAGVFWNCRHCHHLWPVKPEEQPGERRQGRTDRRRHTRADRRKPPAT